MDQVPCHHDPDRPRDAALLRLADGRAHWTKGKREDIANDPLNLIPVDGPTNGSKSDSGPAAWLPPSKGIRCSYAVRFAQVSQKYDLPVTAADKQAMLAQCAG